MFQVSSLIIATSISLTNYTIDISHKNTIYKSPTLSQPLQTNNTLIKEQHEEIIGSLLIESIKNHDSNK